MPVPANIFWDSCVFINYLTGTNPVWVQHIEEWINSARADGGPKIHYSTLCFAEIKPSHLKEKNFGSFDDLLDSIAATFSPVDPVPEIMQAAARMRDIKPIHPIKKADRVISMADAIQLSSCVFAREQMGVEDLIFQTYDHKVGTNAGEKTVPIIGLEQWFEPSRRNGILHSVCGLTRTFPDHPTPSLPGISPVGGTRGSGIWRTGDAGRNAPP